MATLKQLQEESSKTTFGKGSVTINKPGHKLHGKKGDVFHRHDDGRVNVQVRHSAKKGDISNLTLKPEEFNESERSAGFDWHQSMAAPHKPAAPAPKAPAAPGKPGGKSIKIKHSTSGLTMSHPAEKPIPHGYEHMKEGDETMEFDAIYESLEEHLPVAFHVPKATVKSKKGTYGTSYSSAHDEEGEGEGKEHHSEPGKSYSADALTHALGLAPRVPEKASQKRAAAPKVTHVGEKGKDRKAVIRDLHKQLKAGKISRDQYRSMVPESVTECVCEGVEYLVIRESYIHTFIIEGEGDEVVAEGRAPTHAGAIAQATRLIEKTVHDLRKKEDKKKHALDIAKKFSKK